MSTVKNPARVAINKIYPASIYANPAISPLVVGVNGTVGAARRNSNDMYRYTLQQMAVSPFAVNSEEYMKRIRNEYGIADSGMYEAMGTVGAVVGTGMGALIGAGGWRGIHTDKFSIAKPSTWFTTYQNPFQNPIQDGMPVGSKRLRTSEAFRTDNLAINKFIKTNKDLVDKYNDSLKGYNIKERNLNKILKSNPELSDINKLYNNLDELLNKGLAKDSDEVLKVLDAIKTASTKIDNKDLVETYTNARKAFTESSDLFKANTKVLSEAAQKITVEASDELLTRGASQALKTIGKGAVKAAGMVVGIVGTAADVASAGLNIAGMSQAVSDGNIFDAALYTIGALGDITSIVGDVVQLIPALGTAVGTVLNVVGTLVSMGASALIGSRVGETIGHSLTPEGMTAQGLFARNLYGSLIDRPLTSLATVLTTIGVPAALNAASSSKHKWLSGPSGFFVHNAWGNYARSALTMMATQGINSLTTKVEDTWHAPEQAADVNFVTAFSLVGDINDNLYGATARKATLLGLVKGDSRAQTEALARAWGYSNTDIYYNPTFDDIRQEAGIDLGNLGNSIIGTIGEIIIDPQNLSEIADKISTEKIATRGASLATHDINVTRAKIVSGDALDSTDYAAKLLFNTTDNGDLIKTVKHDNNEIKLIKKNQDYYKLDVQDNKIVETLVTDPKITKLYDTAEYDTTYVGKYSKPQLEKELYAYYINYLNKGRDGVRDVYISRKAQYSQGSRYTAENISDVLFVDNMVKFIDNVYKKHTDLNVLAYKTKLKQMESNNPEEFKNKFKSLYTYYGVKESGDLIDSIISEFNLRVNDTELHKLYSLHEGFRNQMDLIDRANTTINQLANPLLNVSQAGIQDLVTYFRSKTSVQSRAKLLMSIKDLEKGFTHEDINEAKKEIEIYNNNFKTLEVEDVTGAVKVDAKAQAEIEKLQTETDKWNKIVEEIKDDIKSLEDNRKQRVYKDYTVYDNNREVITITKNNAKDIYKTIEELSKKPFLSPMEQKRLDAYTLAYVNYEWDGVVDDVKIKYLQETSKLYLFLDEFSRQATTIFIKLLKEFNKFTTLSYYKDSLNADDYRNLETINKQLAQLGIDKTIVIKDDSVKLEDAQKQLVKHKPVKNNLRMYYKVDLAEYLCTLFNGELQLKFGESITDNVGVKEVATLRKVLHGVDFKEWSKIKDNSNRTAIERKMDILKALIVSITDTQGATSFRSYLLANEGNILNKIIKQIDNACESAENGRITVSQPLNNVDINFLKRTVMHSMSHQSGFQKLFNKITDQVEAISKYLEEVDNTLAPEKVQVVTILKAHLKRQLHKALDNNVMYDMIDDYIYTKSSIDSPVFTLSSESRNLYTLLSKSTLKKLKEGKLSVYEVQKLHQEIATSPIVKQLVEMYNTSEYIEKQKRVKQQAATVGEENTEATEGLIDPEEYFEEKENRENFDKSQAEFFKGVRSEIPYDLDSNKPSQVFKAHYNINTRNTHTKDKYTVSEVVSDLLNNGIATDFISNDGSLEITIRPTHFITRKQGSKEFGHFIADDGDTPGVDKLAGYQAEVEYFVDELLSIMKHYNKDLSIIRKSHTYTFKNNQLCEDGKYMDAEKYKNFRKGLVYAYTRYGRKKSKGIVLKYDSSIKTDTGYVHHNTAMYFKKLLYNELTKTLAIAMRNDEIKEIPAYGGITPTYETPKEYVAELNRYIYYLKKNNLDATPYEDYIKRIYVNARTNVEKQLSFDTGLKLNRVLENGLDRLFNFETNTIKSRNPNSPIIATDIVKKAVSNDTYLRTLLKDFNTEDPETDYIKLFNFLESYIIETSSTRKKFSAHDFEEIKETTDETTGQSYYTFKHKHGYEVSLIELIFEYHINKEQLDNLLNTVLKNEPNTDKQVRLHAQVNNVYTEWTETFLKKTTKEEFVRMIESKLDINSKSYDKDIKEAEEAYDVLYGDLKTRTLINELTYVTRKKQNDDGLTQISNFHEIYNSNTLKLYNDAVKKYNDNIVYDGIKCNTLDDYLLMEVLNWKPKKENQKKFLLENIFFVDFKSAQSVFSDSYVETIDARIRLLESIKDENNPWYDVQIDSLKTYREYLRPKDKPAPSLNKETKETFIQKVMNNEYDNATIMNIFKNRIKVSDKELYVPVRISDTEYKLATVNTASFLEQTKKGAGATNLYILSRFYNKFANIQSDSKEFTWDDGFNHALIVNSKADTHSQAKLIKENYIQSHPDMKQVYVITPDQFKEIKEMYDSKKIISYTITDNKVKKDIQERIDNKELEPWETTFIENRINVKAQKTVEAYREDLHNIGEYLSKDENNLHKLKRYVKYFNKYPMFLKSNLSELSIKNTDTYDRMLKDAKVSELFFDFIDNFKDADGKININLDVLGDFFTDDYIKKGINLQSETPIMYELANITINGKSAVDILKETLEDFHDKYADTDITFDYSRVLNSSLVNNIFKIKNFITLFLNQASKAQHQGALLTDYYKKMYDEDIREYDIKLVQDQQEYNETVWNNLKGNTLEEKIASLTEDYKHNKKIINDKYATRLESINEERSWIKNRNLNFKTTHTIIKTIEQLEKDKVNLFKVEDTKDGFKVVYANDSIKYLLDESDIEDIVATLKRNNYSNEDIYNVIYTDIIRPFIQNIALDFRSDNVEVMLDNYFDNRQAEDIRETLVFGNPAAYVRIKYSKELVNTNKLLRKLYTAKSLEDFNNLNITAEDIYNDLNALSLKLNHKDLNADMNFYTYITQNLNAIMTDIKFIIAADVDSLEKFTNYDFYGSIVPIYNNIPEYKNNIPKILEKFKLALLPTFTGEIEDIVNNFSLYICNAEIAAEAEKYKKELGLSGIGVRKQKNKITNNDFNFYSYKNNNLQRTNIIMFREGFTRNDQKNVMSIAQRVSQQTNLNIEKATDKLLNKISTKFSKDINTYVPSADIKASAITVTDYLTNNNIKTIKDLYEHYYNKSAHKDGLTLEQYIDAADAYSAYTNKLRLNFGKHSDETIAKAQNKLNAATSKFIDSISDKYTTDEAVDLLMKIYTELRGISRYKSHVYKKDDIKYSTFKDDFGMIRAINSNVLNISRNFYSVLKGKYMPDIKVFGFNKDTNSKLIHALNKAETLSDFYSEVLKDKTIQDKQEVLYKLLITINHFKEEFKHSNKSWTQMIYAVDTKELATNVMNLQSLDFILGYGSDDGKHLNMNIYRSVKGLQNATRTIQALNNDLATVVVDDAPTYVKHATPSTLIFQENKFSTAIRQMQTFITRPLFQPIENNSLGLDLAKLINRDFAIQNVDLIQEITAGSLNECLSGNTFHDIRTLFTEIMKIIVPEYKDTSFVRITNVTEALRAFEESPINKLFYQGQYDIFCKDITSKEQLEKLNVALKNVVDYFDNTQHLIKMNGNTETVKAVIGYIYYHRYSKADDATKHSVHTKFVKEHAKQTIQFENKVREDAIHKIYNIAHSTNLTVNERKRLLAKEIYHVKFLKELTKQELKHIESIIAITDDESKLMKDYHLYDTYDINIKDVVNKEEFKTYVSKSNVISIKRNKVDVSSRKVSELTTLIKQQEAAKRTIKGVNGEEEFKVTKDNLEQYRNTIYNKTVEIIDEKNKLLGEQNLLEESLKSKRNLEILNFIQSDECKELFDMNTDKYKKYIDEKIKALEKTFDKTKNNFKKYKEFDDDSIVKFIEAKMYVYTNDYYEVLSTFRDNLNDPMLADVVIALGLDATKLNDEIQNFKTHIENLDAFEALINKYPKSKTLLHSYADTLTETVRSIHNINDAFDKYNSIDWKNITADDEEFKTASQIFYGFIKSLGTAKHAEAQQIYKDFKKALDKGVEIYKTTPQDNAEIQQYLNNNNVYITSNTIKSVEANSNKAVRLNLKGIQTIYNNMIDKLFMFKDQTKLELVKDDNELNITDDKLVKSFLGSTIYHINSVRKNIQEKVKDSKTLRSAIKQHDKLNIETVKEYVKPEYIKNENSKSVINDIVYKSIKEGIDIENFLLKPMSDTIKYNILKAQERIYDNYDKIIEQKEKLIKENNDKVLHAQGVLYTLQFVDVENDIHVKAIQDRLSKKYSQDLITYSKDYVGKKFEYALTDNEEYSKLKKEINEIKQLERHNNKVFNDLDDYENNLGKLEEYEIEKQLDQEDLDKALEELVSNYEKLHKAKTNTSNYKLYCNYFGDASVNDILNRAIKDGFITEKDIMDAGERTIHNPVVDCAITMYNYLYQKKDYLNADGTLNTAAIKDFIVFDMETAKDATYRNRPYQMTILYVTKDENGNLKSTPLTIYYSAFAFMDGTVDEPGVYLQQFIKQQEDIYKKEEPDITEDEVKKRVQKIIDKVSSRSNTLSKTQFLINTLARTDVEIVAHNGNRFDFKNFNEFITSNVSHLIRDTYLENNIKINFREVRDRLAAKNASDEYKLKLNEHLDKLEELYNSGKVFSDVALKELENTIMNTLAEITDITIKEQVSTVYANTYTYTGNENKINLYTQDNEIFDELQNYFIAYYKETDDAKKEIILNEICSKYEDKKETIIKIFKETESQLFKNKEKEDSVFNQAVQNIIKEYNLTEKYSSVYNPEVRMNAMLSEIEIYTKMIDYITTKKETGYKEFVAYQQKVNADIAKLNNDIKDIDVELEKLNEAIKSQEDSERELYSALYDAVKLIRNKQLYEIRSAKMRIRHDLDTLRASKNLSDFNKTSLEYNVHKAEKDMDKMYTTLKALVEALDDSKLKDAIQFKDDVTNIATLKDIEKQRTIYNERTVKLNSYLDDLTKTWNECWDDIKESSSKMIEEYQKEFNDYIEIIKAQCPSSKDFLDTLDITKVKNEKDLKDLRKTILKYRDTDSEFKTYMIESDTAHKWSTLFAKDSTYKNYLNIVNSKTTPVLNDNNKQITTKLIQEELTSISNSVLLLNTMSLKKQNIVYNDIGYHIDVLLKNHNKNQEEITKIKTAALEQALFQTSSGSIYKGDADDEDSRKIFLTEFKKYASSYISDPLLLEEGIGRFYNNARSGNDILALTIDPEVAVYKEDDNSIRISYNTENYNCLQTLIIPKDEKGMLEDSKKWRVEINYTYNVKGKELNKPSTFTRSYKLKDFKEAYNSDKLYTSDGLYKGQVLYKYMVFENYKDTNRDAIKRLMDFINAIPNKEIKKHIKNNAVYSSDLNINNLKIINLSEQVRTNFAKYITLYNIAQESDFYIKDTSGLYREIFKRTMGNLNALKYGQYLMRMPEEFGNDTILKVLNDGVDKLNIELLKAAEANMGWSFAIKDEYSIEPMFGANTNSVRSVLTSNLLYGNFTPIGLNNKIFKLAGEDKDLEKYLNDSSIGQKIRDLLLEGKDVPIFTPRVAQSGTLQKYEEDILHPLGLNLPVAFTSDVRAFEDDFLIDRDYALLLGWNEGNKTWLKYGFKGAVKFVKGLSEMYNGAVVVGKAPSVKDRGSYGAYLEMAFNRILDYKLGYDTDNKFTRKASDLFDNTQIDNIKKFTSWEEAEADKDKGLIYIVKNKIITEQSEIIDYVEFLNNLLQNKVDLSNKKITNTAKYTNDGIEFVEIIKAKALEDSSYNVMDPITDQIRTIKYNKDNNGIFYGTIYTLMDSEHTASHMQTQAALKNKTDTALSYMSKDISGSVEKGGMVSYVVIQSAAQKVGFDFTKGIIGGEDDTATKKLAEITFKIFSQDVQELFKDKEKDTVEATVENIMTHYELPDTYRPYLREYYHCIDMYNAEGDSIWNYRKEDAEHRLKNYAVSLYSGGKGLGYRTEAKRYWAARNQLLANSYLRTGEVKFPVNAFNELSKYGKDSWIKKSEVMNEAKINELLKNYSTEYNEDLMEITFKEDNGKIYIKFTDDSKQDYAELYRVLRYLGFLDDNYGTFKGEEKETLQGMKRITKLDSLEVNQKGLIQTTAYVMAIRSPVQDYAATPVLKITGVVDHAAVEGNAAMYKIMGADNDGDTAAFIACKFDEVENGVLKNLNASIKENKNHLLDDYADGYYDKGYLKSLRKDLGISNEDNLSDNALEEYKHAYTNYAYIGKKTSASSLFNITAGVVTDTGKKKIIRKDDAHYTWTEMLASASPEILKELKESYKDYTSKLSEQQLKDFKDNAYASLKGTELNDMFWVESHIWIYSKKQSIPDAKGYNNNFYEDINQVKKYYDANKESIQELKFIEYYINNTEDGKLFLEKYRKDAINAAHYATLVRGHVSKVNIGKTGGLRKDVNLGTLLSIFPNMNRTVSSNKLSDIITAQNKLWESQYGITDVTKLTIETLTRYVFDKVDLFEYTIEELKELKNNIKQDNLSTHIDSLDFEIIANTVIDAVIEYKLIQKGLPQLIKLIKMDTPTYKNLKELLDIEGENYLLEPMLSYYRYLNNLSDEELSKPLNEVMLAYNKTYYLSRFVNEFEKQLRDVDLKDDSSVNNVVDEYLKNFKKQYILTRIISKQLNDTIQVPISLSKHGASLGDYTKVHEELVKNGEDMAKNLAFGKVFFGPSAHHRRAIAMGSEYNIFERKEIAYKASQKLKEIKSENANASNEAQILSAQNIKGTLGKAINAIVKYDIFKGFISPKELDKGIEHYKKFTKLISNNISAKGNNKELVLDKLSAEDLKAIKEAVIFFEKYNVSIYRLINSTFTITSKIKEAKEINEEVKAPEGFDRLMGLMSLKGIDKVKFENTYKNASKDIKYVMNYIIEKDNPISDAVRLNDDTIDDILEDEIVTNVLHEYTDKDYWTASAEGVGIKDYEYPTALQEKATLNKFIEELAVLENNTTLNKTELIQKVISDLYKSDMIRRNQLDILNDHKDSKNTVASNIQRILDDNVTGYHILKPHIDKATLKYKNIQDIEKAKKDLERQKASYNNKRINLQLEQNKYNRIKYSLEKTKPAETLKLLEADLKEVQANYDNLLKNTVKYKMLDNIVDVMDVVQSKQTPSLKILDNDDVKHFENQLLVNMDRYQHPFHILVNAFTVNGEPDWNAMYRYIKDNYAYIRITEVVKAEEDEGLARKLIDYIKVTDTEKYKVTRRDAQGNKYKTEVSWDELEIKEQKKYLRKHNEITRVKSFEDLEKLTSKSVGDIKFILNGKKRYDALGKDVALKDFITPTLKQIRINSPKDLETIFEKIKNGKYAIGFTYLNDILSATEDAYKPYTLTGKASYIAAAFNAFQKATLRMSGGFLIRNAIDTFNQLASDMYLEQGLGYMAMNTKQLWKYIKYGENVYDVYSLLSEERMFTLSEINLAYKQIEKDIDIDKNLKLLYRYLNSYIKQAQADTNPSERITKRLKRALEIEKVYHSTKVNDKSKAYKMFTFLGSIKFQEYYKYFDNKYINGEWVLGLRIDADANTKRTGAEKIKRIVSTQDELFDQLLIDISAFMQTNAYTDMFRQKQYKELHVMLEHTKYELTHDTRDATIKEIEQEIESIRKESEKGLNAMVSNKVLYGYKHITERTENLARILGFIFNRDIYGKSFDDSTQRSLKTWFNYGQRSPLEIQLMYDIPYISFPIRSIANWTSRLLDPRYAILMDDIIDGLYGQYADEDGQYNEYEQFMIKNGWLPITNTLGIRMGSGAFDIQNILQDPVGQITQRYSPVLRGLNALIQTGDLAQAAKQLATVGKLNQAAQTATLGAYNANKGTLSTPAIGRTFTTFFTFNEEEKYTPKKYGYLYNNNGRAKYYENIYKDWFNKYGRMRKPPVDPYQLVKGIQWKQFVRQMQNKTKR